MRTLLNVIIIIQNKKNITSISKIKSIKIHQSIKIKLFLYDFLVIEKKNN